MLSLALFLHYSTIALTVAINSLGVGIGEGIASLAALRAINKQPSASSDIMKTAVFGMALIETAAIMGVIISIMLIFGTPTGSVSLYTSLAEVGIMLAICLAGLVIGIVSAFPVQQACHAIARQPFFSTKIARFMLITQSIIQTPIIFGFLIAVYIHEQAHLATTLSEGVRLLACGLSIGLGSIGPAIGLAHFAKVACRSLGINRSAYPKLLTFTFLSEAIIETPIIFAMIVSLLIMISTPNPKLATAIALISAAFSIGIGTFGTGISSGRTAAQACHQIARNPEQANVLSKVSMFAQGLMDTIAIYALLVALALLFF